MENTLRKGFVVSSYDVDSNGKARLTSIANYLQETAYHHADSLGIGYRQLALKQSAWILSRMKIKMYEYPSWDESIQVETWPRGIEKLFALRDFKIFSTSGKLLGCATTCWLMVDLETHRPLRISQDFIPIELRRDSVFDATPKKIILPPVKIKSNEREVHYSDLDVVGHVNNVRFIEWCVDNLPAEDLIQRGISDFEINYIGEARISEKIELYSSSKSAVNSVSPVFIEGRHAVGGRECFRAKVVI